jgi:hypothetical protein
MPAVIDERERCAGDRRCANFAVRSRRLLELRFGPWIPLIMSGIGRQL